MTAAVAGRAASTVRAGAVTQAEKDVLARKLAAAQAAQGGGAQPVPKPVQKATTAAPASPPRAQTAPVGGRARPAASKPSGGSWAGRLPGTGGVVSNGAGFILALAFWGWIVLPFIKGGPAGVRDVIRAKFINKAADGSWLP